MTDTITASRTQYQQQTFAILKANSERIFRLERNTFRMYFFRVRNCQLTADQLLNKHTAVTTQDSGVQQRCDGVHMGSLRSYGCCRVGSESSSLLFLLTTMDNRTTPRVSGA
ncbi:hypothetical protein AVEN_122649-1 [Araneus ventricosus]|uniref:Uncharacterized protein n=1 Tax=Araneus ventricosus TaxID=182803 RepID=A0A4Y2FIP8_ARAVE|nr:hypothetical protein AVEN_122649-1 [Araneus ventricosus]